MMNQGLTFEDVTLVPQYNNVPSVQFPLWRHGSLQKPK